MPSRSTSVKKRGKKAATVKKDSLMSLYKPMFDRIDVDGSGLIDAIELMTAFQEMLPEDDLALVTPSQIAGMISSADMNGDGELDIHEFISVMEESKGTVSLWAKAHQSMWGRVKKQMDVAASVGDTMFKPVHGVVNLHSTGITAGGVKLRLPPAIFRLLTPVIDIALTAPVFYMGTCVAAMLIVAVQNANPFGYNPLTYYSTIGVFVFMLILSFVLFFVAASRGQTPAMFFLGTHYRDQRTGEVCGFGTLLALYTITSICGIFSAGTFLFIDFWAPFFTVQGQSLTEKIYGVVLCVKE